MVFFKKKGPEKITSLGKGFIPSERVKELFSKGFTEADIIDILRKEGFSADEIDKGLTYALKAGVTEAKPATPTFPPRGGTMTALPTLEEIKPEMPAVPETSLPGEYYSPDTYSTEEYIEYVVNERMSELDRRIEEFYRMYEVLGNRIEKINTQLGSLVQRPEEKQLLMEKLEEFKDSIEDVNIRLSGLENAFKEILPALIESVRALSDLVQKVKKEA